MILHSYEEMEYQILKEEPYNSTKHFIHVLPEIFYEFSKIVVWFLLIKIILVTMVVSMVTAVVDLDKSQIIEMTEELKNDI